MHKEKKIPLTVYKGVILPGVYDFDGYVISYFYKNKVKLLFKGFNFKIGLNVYSWRLNKIQLNDIYRHEVINFINKHFKGKYQVYSKNDNKMITEDPLNDENWKGLVYDDEFAAICFESEDGGRIGRPDLALSFIQRGIKPQLANKNDKTCSIGFCDREQKWYGWSPKALRGFGIGSKVKQGTWEAKTLDDAKEMAITFAEGVS